MKIVIINEIEYINLLVNNLKNIPIWADSEALNCYKEKELIKVCKGDNALAIFLIPLDNNGVRRKFRFFPYCMPILLSDTNNIKKKEIYKLIFNYIFSKYDYTFIPLHPDFKVVSSISSEDGFVEMRHTHVLINNFKPIEFSSKLKNHIRSAEKKVLVYLDSDYSKFNYDLAIKGDLEEQKERTELAKKLLDSEKSFLVKAIYDNEVIAGIQVIYDKEWAYLLHSYQKNKIRGTIPLLIDTAIKECFQCLNIKFFDLEGSVIDEIDDFFSSFDAKVITYPYIIHANTEERFIELIKRSKNIQGRVKKTNENN